MFLFLANLIVYLASDDAVSLCEKNNIRSVWLAFFSMELVIKKRVLIKNVFSSGRRFRACFTELSELILY